MRKLGFALLGALIISMMIFSACTPVSELPAEATSIAETVVAGAATVQSMGETILTQPAPMTPTPEGVIVIDISNLCIPPLEMTNNQLTELTLADGRKLVVTNGWLSLFNADGTLQTTLQVPAERDTPLVDLDVAIETFRCETTNLVYYNPTSVE